VIFSIENKTHTKQIRCTPLIYCKIKSGSLKLCKLNSGAPQKNTATNKVSDLDPTVNTVLENKGGDKSTTEDSTVIYELRNVS